jgi:hypothetical protein
MEADWRVSRHVPSGSGSLPFVQEMVGELKGLGATFFRVTAFPDCPLVAVEGWRLQPQDQGPELQPEDVIGFGT